MNFFCLIPHFWFYSRVIPNQPKILHLVPTFKKKNKKALGQKRTPDLFWVLPIAQHKLKKWDQIPSEGRKPEDNFSNARTTTDHIGLNLVNAYEASELQCVPSVTLFGRSSLTLKEECTSHCPGKSLSQNPTATRIKPLLGPHLSPCTAVSLSLHSQPPIAGKHRNAFAVQSSNLFTYLFIFGCPELFKD